MRATYLALPLVLAACAQGAPPTDWSKDRAYNPVGFADRVDASILHGSFSEPALYAIRVKIAAGGTMPPHTHPDTRMMTVLSGEVWYGFGEEIDLASAPLYSAGDFFIVPGGQPHYARAKTDVVYEEAGMGPTATTPLE